MATHQKTLNSLITVLNQRKDVLQGMSYFFGDAKDHYSHCIAIFSQLSQGVESRFKTFAWGMVSYNPRLRAKHNPETVAVLRFL